MKILYCILALMVSAMESLTAPIELPDPIILFTFDDVSEGALPAGWTAENWSSGPGIEEENFQHLGSPVFNDWVIVNGPRFNNPMGVYSNAALDNTDYQRVLQNRSDNIVNGEVISSLAQGNILFANSGYHQGGGSQILFLETSDIDLSGHSDIFISFHSLYEQNQDSSGSLEYSVDGGDTWLPILYMLDQDDIVRSSETGEIDGLETMVLEHGDWAFSSDGSFGGKFSDFIRVDPFDVDLAPFISGRVNDDPVESKRVELFRLPAADNQQRVKFRFSLTGTDSWYWGIDNFGIYSIPELRLVNLSPVDGATGVSPDGEFLAVIEEGSSERLDQSSIQLLLDGNPVTPTIDREGNVVTIRHNPEGLFAPRSQHSFQLTYASLASGAEPVVLTIGFSVLDYPVLTGATLLHKEDFESVTPGQLPTGWSVSNHTTSLIPFYDLQDYSSDAFLDWVVIGTEELDGIIAIEPGLNRLRSQPDHLFINDQKIDQLIQGNFIVAISGWRTGNQIQYLFTRDYDLSSSANPGIVFHSIYEQNQDSMGSVEYSIDGGLTWFPVVYMLDAPDIISGDAVGTFNTRHADVATYVDDESGETLGGTYGSFIGAEVSPQLAAFISARVNDNPLESKRIEIFRLPQAAGQSKVRLRFAYSGTNSYYFGIDELAFYELTGVEPTRLLTQSPLDQATGVSPEAALAIVVQNGTDTSLNISSIQVLWNGAVVTHSVTETNPFTISFDPEGILESGATYSYQFSAMDTAGNPLSAQGSFTVLNYISVNLPQPLYLETFEDTGEGEVPDGWSVVNFSSGAGFPDFDPQHIGSQFYDNWTVVDSQRFNQPVGIYSSPAYTDTDYQRVLLIPGTYVLNGQLVKQVADGKMFFANSGYHQSGGTQVLIAESPDFDLSNQNNMYASFLNIYEQNQDSFGGIEYSIDGGIEWLPALYMLDQADLVLDTNGEVDAVATLSRSHSDIAVFEDPDTGSLSDSTYGSFIRAPITSDLKPFISGRINDNPRESKRVELLRLLQADNQSMVRFRFIYTGTDSWYFGIDNFGLYSIQVTPPPSISAQPVSLSRYAGSSATLSVVVTGDGPFEFQWFRNNEPVDGARSSTLDIASVNASVAGNYYVKVSNSGGSVESQVVTLTLLPDYGTIFGTWDFSSDSLDPVQGTATLQYADGDTTKSLVRFESTDGTSVPHVAGSPTPYLRIPAFTNAANGFHVTLPGSAPTGGGAYLNNYSLVWDVYIPGPLNWTPFFNSNTGNANDADFYVDDRGRLGIGALGYSVDGVIQPDTWHRIAFVADLGSGIVTYWVDGSRVLQSTNGSLDGRFSLFTANDAGPDILMFNEPSGSFTHELLISSFLVVNKTLSSDELTRLGRPTSQGISYGSPTSSIQASIARNGNNIVLSWDPALGPVQIQKSPVVQGKNWQNVGSPTMEGSYTEPLSESEQFFRLVKP